METKTSGIPRAHATPLDPAAIAPGAGAPDRRTGKPLSLRRRLRAIPSLAAVAALAFAGLAVPAASAGAATLTIEEPVNGAASTDPTPSFSGTTDGSTDLFGKPYPVTLRIYEGTDTSGSLAQAPETTVSEASWSAVAEALTPGTYTAVAEQASGLAMLGEREESNTVTFAIDEAPHVTSQPSDATVTAGGTAQFKASAGGVPAPEVQWEVSTNGGATWKNDTSDTGAGSETLTVSGVSASQNGNEYRATFTSAAGEAQSQPARLEVLVKPEVTSNPAEVVATAGSPASFTAEAFGRPAPTVQWQVSKDGGITWSNDSDPSAHSTTLTIASVSPSQNGNEYRAVFSNSAGSTPSLPAALEVDYAPVVTQSPSSHAVNKGETTTFTATASGNPPPTVQWEVSTDFGHTWETDTADEGATTPTLKIASATTEQSGNQYRAVFSNSLGSASSSAATLTVHEPKVAPSVTSNPSNRSVIVGETAAFTASATGNPLPSVQWQVLPNGSSTWTNDTGDAGAKTTTLLVESATAAQSGNRYRAVFTNGVGEPAQTTAATLTVSLRPEAPKVTKAPTGIERAVGEAASFTAAASGVPSPSVQWQVLVPGGSWVADTVDPGNATTTLQIPAPTAGQNGNEYRAVFSNASGTAETASARLIVLTPPAITLQPGDVTVASGGTAHFKAEANGVPAPHAQWEYSKDGKTWSEGPAGDEWVIPSVATSLNGSHVRVVFSNKIGGVVRSVTSRAALLTVTNAPFVQEQPPSTPVVAGAPVAFTAVASGSPPPSEVQWQVHAVGASGWSTDAADPAETTVEGTLVSTTLRLAAVSAAQSGNEYRAVFKQPGDKGEQVTTHAAVLTVNVPPSITGEPSDATAGSGAPASFDAAASGAPTPDVQWQISTDGGATFTPIAGATADTLTLPAVTADDSGHLFRAVFTNLAGQATTRAASLTVSPPPPAPAAPSASFAWFPTAPQVGEVVTLASTSTDPSSPITGFAWDPQGTNVFTPGSSVTTTLFTTPGDHTVQLRVSDGNGQSSVATEHVLVTSVKLKLLQPFPVVRIAGTDSHFGAHISLLSVQAPVGAHVLVSCTGRGCPRAREARTARAGKSKSSVVVMSFRRFERSLRAGVKLEVRVYAPGLIGKYTSFRIRHSKLPARTDACLNPRTLKAMTCPT